MLHFKAVRLLRGMSQGDLADRAAIARPWLSRIETGRVNPTPEEQKAIAKALRIPVDSLLRHVSEEGLLAPGAECRDEARS